MSGAAGAKAPVLILGCGYTGSLVARMMAGQGHAVWATSRRPEALALPDHAVRLWVDTATPESLASLARIPSGSLALISVPVVRVGQRLEDPLPPLLEALRQRQVSRVVYLSTTGVYGSQTDVDETTEPAPASETARLRLAAERAVLEGPWSAMVLRPAAIYGPGRGIHVSMARGEFKLAGDGSNWVSRVHVEDLARLCAAALLSREGGCWPVADQRPARSAEIAAFVAGLLGCPMPDCTPAQHLHETRQANRRVDGSAVFRLLGITLRYPSYREGIPASLVPGSLKC